MRYFLSLFMLVSTPAMAREEFGFVYSWDMIHTYNSFTDVYTREVCGDRKIYSVKLKLGNKYIISIKKKLDDLDFWHLDTSELVTYGVDDGVMIISSPCGSKSLFSQKGNMINYLWASCEGFPDSAEELGVKFLTIVSGVEKEIGKNKEFKKAPNSECTFR